MRGVMIRLYKTLSFGCPAGKVERQPRKQPTCNGATSSQQLNRKPAMEIFPHSGCHPDGCLHDHAGRRAGMCTGLAFGARHACP